MGLSGSYIVPVNVTLADTAHLTVGSIWVVSGTGQVLVFDGVKFVSAGEAEDAVWEWNDGHPVEA